MNRLLRTSMVVLAVVLPAGCGAPEQETPGVASAGGATATASARPTADLLATWVEGQRKLARCIREAGWPVDDPNAKGELNFFPSGKNEKTNPQFQAALGKCKEFQKPYPQELIEVEPQSPEQIQRAFEYAKCVRANGDPTFPDPGPDGYFNAAPPEPTQQTEQELATKARATMYCTPILDGKPAGTTLPPGQG